MFNTLKQFFIDVVEDVYRLVVLRNSGSIIGGPSLDRHTQVSGHRSNPRLGFHVSANVASWGDSSGGNGVHIHDIQSMVRGRGYIDHRFHWRVDDRGIKCMIRRWDPACRNMFRRNFWIGTKQRRKSRKSVFGGLRIRPVNRLLPRVRRSARQVLHPLTVASNKWSTAR